ncbi:hypothetical protein ASD62_13405 [Phycicoccus sp. Root563]|uniref:RDD family protein n=1 Tax=Phycicoccus sp. Root563 TaxID=1736562 RepID=UPI0007023EBA|nr:RDD family protein [Phycicoccus sp. Root563]KQZ90146.1 hypothetical protein ASD62_13405 [Phycicoccus sp. Root563]
MTEHQAFSTSGGTMSGQWVPMAGWWRRVAASLIDAFVVAAAQIPYYVGLVVLLDAAPGARILGGDPADYAGVDLPTLLLASGLMLLGSVLGLVAVIWNRFILQGRTGQSLGKSALKLYLVSAQTGTPVGAGTAFVRDIVHIVDGLFYLGYLWPLWDSRKQTFADKIVGTVVAHAAPVGAPGTALVPPVGAPLPQ